MAGMRAFSFVGWSGSGKTTLIERLTLALAARGRRVVCLKQAHHAATFQPEGKDTARFLAAGAAAAFLVGDGELLRMERVTSAAEAVRRAVEESQGCDVLLLEGAVMPAVPVVGLLAPDEERPSRLPAEQLAAVVGAADPRFGVPFFKDDDIEGLLAFMEGFDGKAGGPQGR